MKPVRRIFMGLLLLMLLASNLGMVHVAAAEADWIWISSDSKYSKFFDPSKVQVTSSTIVANGKTVATSIQAWTKTAYSYEGAAETIQNYGIQAILPNPAKLAYSLALVEINPQNRTIEYVQENFYDQDGNAVWSKIYNPRTIKEINSQAFDEDFYTAIVDQVFRHGETERRTAKDRWITLWTATAADGSSTNAIADTTTMRMKGDNLFYWEWVEEKNAQGTVQEIKFMKKAVNLQQATQKVITCKYWSTAGGWQDLTGELDGLYTAILPDSYGYAGLTRLRAYANGYQYWVNRYSLEK